MAEPLLEIREGAFDQRMICRPNGRPLVTLVPSQRGFLVCVHQESWTRDEAEIILAWLTQELPGPGTFVGIPERVLTTFQSPYPRRSAPAT